MKRRRCSIFGLVWKRAIRPAIARGDHGRRELGGRGQEPAALRQRPFALLVELADHPRADGLAPVVELLLELVLEVLALLLDDQDLLQPLGEVAGAVGLERPGHADLHHPQADLGRELLVDAEIVQRLADVEIGLAGGDDARAAGAGCR